MKGKRKKYSAEFKTEVALAALQNQMTVSEITEKYQVSTGMIYKWRDALVANASAAFADKKADVSKDRQIDNLHRKIGELEMMLDFAKRVSRQLGIEIPADN